MKKIYLYNYNTEKSAFCYINVKKSGKNPAFLEICMLVFAVPLNVSFAVFFSLRITLVVKLLASAKSQLHFYVRPTEVKGKGNDGKALLTHLAVQLHDLSLVHKELAVAQGIAVKNVALLVGTDVYPCGEDLAAFYFAIGILEVYLTCAETFYFCTEKLDPRFVLFVNEIIVVSLFVLGDYLSSRVFISQILTSHMAKIKNPQRVKLPRSAIALLGTGADEGT